MKIAIHQPNFFPWAGYFYKIYLSDIFVFLDDVKYSKNSYTNRASIILEKKNNWLTIPVKSSLETKIYDIQVADSLWQKKHLSKLVNAYKSSDFFSEIYYKISQLYDKISSNNLADINYIIIKEVSNWLKIERKFYRSSDLRINKNLSGDDRLIEIIKSFNGKVYFSGEGARKYQNKDKYTNYKINLKYTEFIEKKYQQSTEKFISGTSILDLLFNLGIEKTIKHYNFKIY